VGPAGAAFSTGALSEGGSALSARAQLRQFGITALEYAIPGGQVAEVRIRIYSIAGQLVRNLVREQQGSGDYHAQWDGLNERGERVAPGVYVALMEAGTFKATRKLVITR
jgi:flagellar hook assembly protein FlgD